MKAHDSWPGNKAEEGRLPQQQHIPRDSRNNTQLHVGTEHNVGHMLLDSRMVA